MIILPPAKDLSETRWFGPWPAEKNGYKGVAIYRTPKETGGVMLFIEGPLYPILELTDKCLNVSTMEAAAGAYIKGDLFEFIDMANREGFLMTPLASARQTLEEFLSSSAHSNSISLAQARWGQAQILKSTL